MENAIPELEMEVAVDSIQWWNRNDYSFITLNCFKFCLLLIFHSHRMRINFICLTRSHNGKRQHSTDDLCAIHTGVSCKFYYIITTTWDCAIL